MPRSEDSPVQERERGNVNILRIIVNVVSLTREEQHVRLFP